MSERNEREAVARIVRMHEVREAGWAAERAAGMVTWMACANGPCKQGRKICPTPEACQLAEQDGPAPRVLFWLGIACLVVIAAVAIVMALKR